MDPISLTVVGTLTALEFSRLVVQSIIRRRKDPKRRIDRTVERAETEFGKTSDEYLRDVDQFVKKPAQKNIGKRR